MSYEICLMDPQLAATHEAAFAAWEASVYWESSLPDHERAGRKWQISDALLAFNPELQRMDPTAPNGGGWLGKLKGEAQEERRYHAVSLPHGDYITNFTVFDQAVEVEFAYGADVAQARAIAREAWRHLQALAGMGFTTMLDTERNVLLDLNCDFETVVAGYIAMLKLDAEVDAADDAAARAADAAPAADGLPAASGAPAAAPPRVAQPFTGNVEVKKPWWKIW